jgi:hypothetical protein
MTEELSFDSRQRKATYIFSKTFRSSPGAIQVLFNGVKNVKVKVPLTGPEGPEGG